MRPLYSLLTIIALPWILGRLLWRSRLQPAYRRHLAERFGRYRTRPSGASIWLHAVSVGEMRAAAPLIAELRRRLPQCRWVLSCMTPTGRDTATGLYGDFAEIVYLPYDLPGLATRFFSHFRPAFGVILETEVWPNLLQAARHAAVPIVLANARLSARSARGYQRVPALTRPAFAALALTLAQSDSDAERLQACGAQDAVACGNLKFDVTPNPGLVSLGRTWRQSAFPDRPVVVAASTREGEETLILSAWARIRTAKALLILVPRHPQRFESVARLSAGHPFNFVRRSQSLPGEDTQVWLGDSMGEMASYFTCADLALMGGSLKPFGSQNLIEACACGCPVLVGPSDFNFAQATADALRTGAAVRVAADPEALAMRIDELFADRAALAARRDAAKRFAAAHRGAAARMADAILQKLPTVRA